MVDPLRSRRIEGTKGDIVRSGFTGFHRKVSAVVAGHADLHILAEDRACIAWIAILLAKMDTIGAKAFGEADAVIDDDRGILFFTDFL